MYVGLVLDEISHKRARDMCALFFVDTHLDPDAFSLVCHHMTITMGSGKELKEKYGWEIGDFETVEIHGFGYCDTAVAFKVVLPMGKTIRKKSKFKDVEEVTPHITAAVHRDGKPVDSQKISKWERCRFNVSGTVTVQG